MCYRIAGSGINEILSIPIASTSVRERARFSALASFPSRLSIFSILIDERDTINNRAINLAAWHRRIRSSVRRAIAPTFPTNRESPSRVFGNSDARARARRACGTNATLNLCSVISTGIHDTRCRLLH